MGLEVGAVSLLATSTQCFACLRVE